MGLAFSDASPHSHRRTLSAHELFGLKFSLLKLILLTVLHASEVRLLAFKAAIVSEFVQGKILQFVVVHVP